MGLVRSPPTWTMFRQALCMLQHRPVRRMVRLLSPWAMLPRELPLVRLLRLLLLRLAPMLVLVACLCAVPGYRCRRRHLLGRGMLQVPRSVT